MTLPRTPGAALIGINPGDSKMIAAQQATPGARGIDTVAVLTPSVIRRFQADGVTFAIRYTPFAGSGVCAWDILAQEMHDCLSAGLRVMLVQRCRHPGWQPNGRLGMLDGERAVAHARTIGYPPGAQIWQDLEGVGACMPYAVAACSNAWTEAVRMGGYRAGLYVGAGCGLTGPQLYHDLRVDRYWDSCSRNPEPRPRGWCMLQDEHAWNVKAHGILVDYDMIQADGRGGLPWWAVEVA